MTEVSTDPTERVTPRQFHEADGVGDWRVLGEGACAYFRTGSFAAGARFVHAIGELAGGRLLTDEYAPAYWVLADAEGNEACVGTAGWTGPEPGAR
jgi:hypothetical protein